jgi:hypothetical protein
MTGETAFAIVAAPVLLPAQGSAQPRGHMSYFFVGAALVTTSYTLVRNELDLV